MFRLWSRSTLILFAMVCGIFITACHPHEETIATTTDTVQRTTQPTTTDKKLSVEDTNRGFGSRECRYGYCTTEIFCP
jgi:hypothetical protein